MLTALYVVAVLVALLGIPGAVGHVGNAGWLRSLPERAQDSLDGTDVRTRPPRSLRPAPSMGGHRASQSVDPRTVTQPSSPSGVVSPRDGGSNLRGGKVGGGSQGQTSKALWASVAHARERAAAGCHERARAEAKATEQRARIAAMTMRQRTVHMHGEAMARVLDLYEDPPPPAPQARRL